MEKSQKVIAGVAIGLLLVLFVVLYVGMVIKQSGGRSTATNIPPKGTPMPTITATSTPMVEGGITVSAPVDAETAVNDFQYEIEGASSANITAIELEITNDKNDKTKIQVSSFHKGDTNWSYNLTNNDTTLVNGKNTVAVVAYQDNTEVARVEKTINAEIPKLIFPTMLNVNWDKELANVKDDCNGSEGCSMVYKAGTIVGGDYDGATLYLKSFEDGPGGPNFTHSITMKNGREVDLEENKVGLEGIADIPDSIIVPGKNYELSKGLVAYDFFSAAPDNSHPDKGTYQTLFTNDKLGNFYDMDGCAVAELPDHTAVSYDFELPFGLKEITFADGKKNSTPYSYEREQRGCGVSCSSFVYVDEINLNPDTRLKVAGTAGSGDQVYEFSDPKDKDLKSMYDYYSSSYEPGAYLTPPSTKKHSYSEFLKAHPLLFWKDPFGRWVKFTDEGFVPTPMAEMCKPAIYLYPEKETKLNVKVDPAGGFTYTNPPYGAGWNVEAYPGGRITDLATGKDYGYLYWEGKGFGYPTKDEGWIVKKEDLSGFFDKKLPLVGLTQKEIPDFKTYWLSRLNAAPYYQISFLTLNEFNKLAPISFSPEKPQTLIRVMMQAKGLNEARQIPEQQLPPLPARNGFTAVEWGGMLLK